MREKNLVENTIAEIVYFLNQGHFGAAEIAAERLHKQIVEICELSREKKRKQREDRLWRK